ncbi:MAG: type IV secretory system conjugative DNA transfer family protein, partial [Steroidobacteraceae bacterium]
MSPSANVAAWSAPASPARPGRVLRAAAYSGIALVLAQYLAACVFLTWTRLDVRSASPLTIARYTYYHGQHVEVRRRLLVSLAISFALTLACAGVLVLPRRRALHGSARFARRREIAAAGLLGEQGIILGRIGRRCLMLGGQQGVALAAPPRSGKGVGVVVPNALNWPGSLVCIDIKRENWTL